MKPVHQTIINPVSGNCFAACIASLLELSLDDVPNFCENKNKYWERDCQRWLNKRGLWLFGALIDDNKGSTLEEVLTHAGYTIVSGKSPRFDCNHSVIYYGPKLVHDPHPDGTGVKPVTEVDVIVPMHLENFRQLNSIEYCNYDFICRRQKNEIFPDNRKSDYATKEN